MNYLPGRFANFQRTSEPGHSGLTPANAK